jgi:release factor glutamine methyltransferase
MAQWVIEDVTQLRGIRMVMDRFRVLTSHQEELIDQYAERLLRHEPIQYVLGYAEFYGLQFQVNPSVLIPRPETEELVRWIIEDSIHSTSHTSILDIGTGSGCIPVSLKKHLPDASICAIDISADALAVARLNAAAHDAEISFCQIDILSEIPAGKYHVIVSNPPYISAGEKSVMTANVLNHEPHLALFSDAPLLFYRRIAELAPTILHSGGRVYVEISEYRASEVEAIFSERGFATETRKDIYGRDRMLKAY